MATIVKKKPGYSDDKLIAEFQRQVREEGIIPETRERSRYIKPSRRRYEKEKSQSKSGGRSF